MIQAPQKQKRQPLGTVDASKTIYSFKLNCNYNANQRFWQQNPNRDKAKIKAAIQRIIDLWLELRIRIAVTLYVILKPNFLSEAELNAAWKRVTNLINRRSQQQIR